MSKTIRRDKVLALAQSGQLELVGSYHFDDMTGEHRHGGNPIPVYVADYGDHREGQCHLFPSDFTSSCGRAWLNDDGTITLYVHSNSSYELQLKPGAMLKGVHTGANRAQRPENKRMQAFLAKNGIDATPKWIPDGSLKRTWRLYNGETKWTPELAEKLNALGFRNYDNAPLHGIDGNGGVFSVFVRGHEEFLTEPVAA